MLLDDGSVRCTDGLPEQDLYDCLQSDCIALSLSYARVIYTSHESHL